MIVPFRINFKSDFKLNLHSDVAFTTPFNVNFYAGSRKYVASYDGHNYQNCSLIDDHNLTVYFDDHGLGIGELKMEMVFVVNDAEFPTGVAHEYHNVVPVVTEIDGVKRPVELSYDGETSPEVQFSLTAYAEESEREQAEAQRVLAEQQREESFAQSISEVDSAIANAKADYIGNDGYVYKWNATQQQYVKSDLYAKGADGADGQQGAPGANGKDGKDGQPGPANTLTIGTVVSGSTAGASITGTSPNQVLNLMLPKGDKGDPGTTDYNDLEHKPDLSNFVEKSETNGLLRNDGSVDTNTYLTQHQDISGKEDKVAIDSTAKTASFSASVGNYYKVNIAASGSVTITLTTPSDSTKLSSCIFFVTTSTSPALTFASQNSATIYTSASYSIEASKVYEINAMWNGTAWVIGMLKLEASV